MLLQSAFPHHVSMHLFPKAMYEVAHKFPPGPVRDLESSETHSPLFA